MIPTLLKVVLCDYVYGVVKSCVMWFFGMTIIKCALMCVNTDSVMDVCGFFDGLDTILCTNILASLPLSIDTERL